VSELKSKIQCTGMSETVFSFCIHSFYLIKATWPIEHTHVDKQTRN